MATPAANTAGVITADLLCVRCNYNLRTQPADGVCPECAMPIRETIAFPRLARSAPRWLTSLVDSVSVLLVALAVGLATVTWVDWNQMPLRLCGAAAAAGLAWFAVWLLTRPEPGAGRRSDRVLAWALRLLASGPYAMIVLSVTFSWYEPWWTMNATAEAVFKVVAAVLLSTVVPATFLYYHHLRRAALRLPSRWLAWQAGAMRVLLPLGMIYPIVALVFDLRPARDGAESLLRFPLIGLGSVLDAHSFAQIVRAPVGLWHPLPLSLAPGAVLLIAAAAVLVQFRIAFAAAARAAREPQS